jgi:hypothetical protein
MTMLRTKPLLGGAAVAVLLLLTFAAMASASRLQFRNSSGNTLWRGTWSELRFASGFGTVACQLTLEGSLHSNTIVKANGSLVGFVTGARSGGSCGGSYSSTVLTGNLPWHVRYRFFTGALPNISSVGMEIIGFEFQIREPFFGATCLFRSEERAPLSLNWSRSGAGTVTSLTPGGTITSGDCGINGTFSGSSSSFSPSTTITLI